MAHRSKQVEEIAEGFQAIKRALIPKDVSKLKKLDITPSQWMVIRLVSCKDGMSVKDISQALHVSSSAATQLVESLVKTKYVVRKTSEKDGRAVTLSLSEKNKKQMQSFRKEMTKRLEKIFAALDDGEFQTYCKLHKKIVQSIMI